MALRRLHIDFEALAGAMSNQDRDEYDYYLDTTAGRVMRISTEVWNALEEGRALSGSLQGWQQEELREAREVFGTQGRYVPIPERPDWEIEDVMTEFADSVADMDLREKLTRALEGRDVLHRFSDILSHYPDERSRWLACKLESDQEYAARWLADEGIEPVWISTAERHV